MATPDPLTPETAPLDRGLSVLLGRTFQAFRYRDFRLMWFGAFTSTTGTWMQTVAQAWLVLSLTGSAFYLGLVAFLAELPILLFSLVGGVLADRTERRKLLLLSQYAQMSVAFLLAALIYWDGVRPWHFLVTAFLVGTAQAFGGPAYQALIPGLVEREHLPNAIALNSIQFNLARMIGPVLAGVLLASVGAAVCFLLNGTSFLAVILSLYLIRASFAPQKVRDSVIGEMKQGFRFLKTQGSLWQLSVLGFASTFCGIPLITLLPVFARDIFATGSTGYSTMMAVAGSGSVAGALLYASLTRIEKRGRLTLHVQLLFALFLALFALSRNLAASYVLLFVTGICLISLFTSITSLVQLATTEEMRGRVMSIFMLAFRGGMPLGNLAAGYLASQLSPATALLADSILLGSIAAAFLVARAGVLRI